MSADRIIVGCDVADEFSKCLVEEVKRSYGDGVAFSVLASISNTLVLHDEAREQGVTDLIGDNSSLSNNGASLKPTTVTGVKLTDPLYDDETFGPSESLYVVENEAEALALVKEAHTG